MKKISDLPGDLLLEAVLCRVLATHLQRLRSTCKRWNHLFTKKHYDKAARQFLLLNLMEHRVFSMSVNLEENPSLEVEGKLRIKDSHSNSAQIEIMEVSSCDGLLLCTIKNDVSRIVVCNPCTGQTKWIQPRDRCKEGELFSTYSLGSYQNNKSLNTCYKVLRNICCYSVAEFEICDINSSSWRTIDAPGCRLSDFKSVSFKGKAYWFGTDRNKEHVFLVSFDYTRERFERLSLDPCQFPNGYIPENMALSAVREEKLSMLLKRPQALEYEIWVTNKIDDDETKVMSWIKIFTVDYPERSTISSFSLVDEEKKTVLMCCVKCNQPG
ncbi:unnamed protein product [Microthlaspi erraticum]|uniref:F-box domain-containing protein n=1 Tax=Microthlaspi erraticum TaxID=1685480 RepID=A0A6D2IZT2_9BRAS|nr:unnamed protein product [Microthlaspi erraticum]